MLNKLIQKNYNIIPRNIKLISDHPDAKVYIVESVNKKYILKCMPIYSQSIINEGELIDFLYHEGVNVARIRKTNNNNYMFQDGQLQYHMQEYIVGKVFDLNCAPDWFMFKSAQCLGKIHKTLRKFEKLPDGFFSPDFFHEGALIDAKHSYLATLEQAQRHHDLEVITDLNDRLKHLDRLSTFSFDLNRLTYSNSHGDFYVSQVINNQNRFTVIDWTNACYLPACWEVMMSFTYADPSCKDGQIDIARFKLYLNEYLKYFPLSDYDISIMPYLYYYQLGTCNYYDPYDDLPEEYLRIAKLATNLMRWFYVNVDDFSKAL